MPRPPRIVVKGSTEAILRHWRDAIPNDRLAHLVRDAARGLTRGLQLRLAEHGVPFGHWVFLRILWEKDGITQRELSELAGVMEPTTFAALKAMEKLGYVTRRRHADSRKKVYIYLTEKGQAQKHVLVPLAEEVNETAIGHIPEADVAALRRALLAMIHNLAEDEAKAALEQRRIPSTRALSRLIDEAPDSVERTLMKQV